MTRTGPRAVVVSPFANERARQWPARNYRELIGLIWREHGFAAMIVGTRGQRAVANDLVRGLSSDQAMNTCGAMRWEELIEAVDAAPYVIANNSGVAHLAAGRRRWTLCLFSGSHAYSEWMPRGPFVVTVGRALPCSPLRARHGALPEQCRLHDRIAAVRGVLAVRSCKKFRAAHRL
jgi:ADP-heptose:LPS heptosyltransferase